MEEKIPLIVVCGPTASGKTAVAVRLAQMYDGEVVSADSMQIYKGLAISTAKPTAEEMMGIPHHMIDFLEPDQPFSVADYVRMARDCIADIRSKGKMPIVIPGGGVLHGFHVLIVKQADILADHDVRVQIQQLVRHGQKIRQQPQQGVGGTVAALVGVLLQVLLVKRRDVIELYVGVGVVAAQGRLDDVRMVPGHGKIIGGNPGQLHGENMDGQRPGRVQPAHNGQARRQNAVEHLVVAAIQDIGHVFSSFFTYRMYS